MSRSSRRRFSVRQAARGDANDTTIALNATYGCETRHVGSVASSQQAAVKQLVGSARVARQDFVDITGDEAARQLLGPRYDYGGDNCTVVPFDASLLSVPSLGSRLSTCGKCWTHQLGTLWSTSMITFWRTLKWLTVVRMRMPGCDQAGALIWKFLR